MLLRVYSGLCILCCPGHGHRADAANFCILRFVRAKLTTSNTDGIFESAGFDACIHGSHKHLTKQHLTTIDSEAITRYVLYDALNRTQNIPN